MHSKKFTVTGCNAVNTLKKYSISDREILNRRIKTNPRYHDVQSRTNTGFNTHRRQELEKEIRKYYKVKSDEVFRRISLADLLQLMVAHAEDIDAEENGQNQLEDEIETEVPIKYRDEVENVVHNMDKFELDGKYKDLKCPYVIIDVRTQHEYQTSHLATAVCHPQSRMSRAVGWECPELLAYKNHPEFIIVVYDDSEDLAPEVVATLQHRGYSNVFMLSGGLRLAQEKFGFPLVSDDTSTVPSPQVINAVAQQLADTVLPPLSMADASDWWAAASRVGHSAAPTDSGITISSAGQRTARSQLKTKEGESVRPWR